MKYRSITTILFVGLCSLFFSNAYGASDIKKVKRLVARLQLEVMDLKKKSSEAAGEQMAVLEPQNEKIEKLTKENIELTQKLKDVELKFLLLEEKFEKYKKESSTEQLSELNQLATILTLVTVGEISSLEQMILELINQGNNLKQDLLLLLLAETKKNKGDVEESLSYFVMLISDYENSKYRTRAIFEASELLGKLGHTEDQKNMLEALKDNDGTYGKLARKRLGIEEPVNDSTEDVDAKQNQGDSENVDQQDDSNEQNQGDSENVGQQDDSSEQNQGNSENVDQQDDSSEQNQGNSENVDQQDDEDDEDDEDDY